VQYKQKTTKILEQGKPLLNAFSLHPKYVKTVFGVFGLIICKILGYEKTILNSATSSNNCLIFPYFFVFITW